MSGSGIVSVTSGTFDTNARVIDLSVSSPFLTGVLQAGMGGTGLTAVGATGQALMSVSGALKWGSLPTIFDDGKKLFTTSSFVASAFSGSLSVLSDGVTPFLSGTGGLTTMIQNNGQVVMSSTLSTAVAQWTKYTVPYTFFQTGSLTVTKTLANLPIKTMVHSVFCKHSSVFAGVVSLGIGVGVPTNTLKYIGAFNLLQAVADTVFGISTLSPQLEGFSAGSSINITATSTINNLSSLTQGSVDVWLLLSRLP